MEQNWDRNNVIKMTVNSKDSCEEITLEWSRLLKIQETSSDVKKKLSCIRTMKTNSIIETFAKNK